MSGVHEFEARSLSGEPTPLARFSGNVLLIVNTASECGFTSQYADLETLYRRYRDRGFSVLAFPCNQFGGQEPGSAADIDAFCKSKFSITFPLFEKVDVNGPHAHPLFRFLKQQAPGLLGTRAIKWNFTKFLIAADGSVLRRYAPRSTPLNIAADIDMLLEKRG